MKKNKRFTKNIIFGLLASLLLLTACDFTELNEPKYQVSDEDMKGDNFKLGAFFPQLEEMVYPAQENNYQMNENLIGDNYGRYMMTCKAAWSTANFTVYNAPQSWIDFPFNSVMTNVYTAWNEIRKQTEGKGVNFAWAQILRVAAMQRLTDLYGPIPYSQVATGELKVAYDSQEEVYKAMFKDLNDAIATLTTFVLGHPGEAPMADYDHVYQGDFEKWVRFANSLKLRMALRIRFADAALAQQMAEEAVQHSLGVIVNNSENPKYIYGKGNPITVMWDAYSDTRICADITSVMNGYNDPRMEKYFQTSEDIDGTKGYIGIRSGVLAPSVQWSLKFSSPNIQKPEPLYWMYASEVAFLRAEGALAGWNMGDTEENLYHQGIKLSFESYGVGGYDAYINNDTATPADYNDPTHVASIGAASHITIKWEENADEETKLERIITQKWIAMFPLGQEAWCDIRRTGYPKVFAIPQATTYGTLRVANRIPFSSAEYRDNAENMTEAVQKLGGEDNYATKLWWDAKQ